MRGLKRILCLILALLIAASITVCANDEHNLKFYFSPQVMNEETGEITVDLRMKNFALAVPSMLGEICGLTMAFEYDGEHFDIVCDENGNAVFSVFDDTLIKKNTDIEVKTEGEEVSFLFLDSTLKENLINKDGVLCRFTLKSKNANALWNSGDYYPIRFKEGSVGVVTYNLKSLDVGRFEGAEGIDGKVGGYNTVPDFAEPSVNKKFTFANEEHEVLVNDEAVTVDAAPYIENGEWMIPVRFLSENTGMSVEWNDGIMTAAAYGAYKTLKISIAESEPVVYINAAKCDVQTVPIEKNGRIYIPLELVKRLYPNASVQMSDSELTIAFE